MAERNKYLDVVFGGKLNDVPERKSSNISDAVFGGPLPSADHSDVVTYECPYNRHLDEPIPKMEGAPFKDSPIREHVCRERGGFVIERKCQQQ